MANMRTFFVAILCAALSTSLLFMLIPSRSSPGIGEYNPWADINDDGTVDIFDAILLSNAFNTHGQNLTKASVMYDSGWVNITDKQGQTITITHDLNITDWDDPNILVDITGKTTLMSDTIHRATTSPWIWSKTFGGTDSDFAMALIETTDGGFALAGSTMSNGAGWYDFWLVKTDADGTAEWNRTYGGTGLDMAYALIQTSDGGYALAGRTSSFWTSGSHYWLVKTDADGNHIWNKTFDGGGSDEEAHALVQTDDGGYALAGWSFGAGNGDFMLVKTDAQGNSEWIKTYGGADWDAAYSLVLTGDGGFALAGYTSSFGAGNGDAWLVKTDAQGNAQWDVTYGGTQADQANALVQTGDGGFALAGYTFSFSTGFWADAWLIKTDASGIESWNRTYGGTEIDEAIALIQTGDGGYALAGRTESFGMGLDDLWLVKTDASGNIQWNRTCGGTNYDEAKALVRTSDGGYALAGFTVSFGSGSYDGWLVKTDSTGTPKEQIGFAWVDASANTITLYRGSVDPYWNYVRIRIQKIR